MIRFLLNDVAVELESPSGEVLLDQLRGPLGKTGVKQGCREGDCGACTVLVGDPDGEGLRYRAMPSCMMLVGHAAGRHIVTVEGLDRVGELTSVQRAVAEEGATQCGFCTPGVVMSLTGTLCGEPPATEAELLEAVGGNICRCTGYMSFRRAARRLADEFETRPSDGVQRIADLVESGALPAHFAKAPRRLAQLRERTAGREWSGAPTIESADYGIAGGTDTLVQRRMATEVETPFFFAARDDFEPIRLEGETCVLDAITTFEDLKRSELWRRVDPRAERHMDMVASQIIRERATLAGNIANASPIADGVACLLALGAELELESDEGSRRLPLAEFFLDYKRTALRAGERIRSVRVSAQAHLTNFEKVSRRERLDIATVNTAASFEVVDECFAKVTISAGGVGPTPRLLTATAAHLEGAPASPATVRGALDVAASEVTPISDVRGTAAYKRLLLRQLVLAHFVETLPGRGFEELCL